METIKNYLFNIFSTLPKNSELENLKNNLLDSMEDKYNELKKEGKTENEAIGIVISEFGNIEELINELEIDTSKIHDDKKAIKVDMDKQSINQKIVDKEEAINYIETNKKYSLINSIGVALCILSVAVIILLSQLIIDLPFLSKYSEGLKAGTMVTPMLILIAIAISLFIYAGVNSEKYKYIKKIDFELSSDAKSYVLNKYNLFKSKFAIYMIIGVSGFIMIPFIIVIFVGSTFSEAASVYAVAFLILCVSIAVTIFMNVGLYSESLKILLQLEEFSKEKKKLNKEIEPIAQIVWPVVVCIYLIYSFATGNWGISWIIFPIVALLLPVFKLVSNYKNK